MSEEKIDIVKVSREDWDGIHDERDKWKAEYFNLCKFANDFESERDKWKSLAEQAQREVEEYKFQTKHAVDYWKGIALKAKEALEKLKDWSEKHDKDTHGYLGCSGTAHITWLAEEALALYADGERKGDQGER